MLARQMALEMERAKFPVGGGAAGRRSSAPTLAHAEASERGAAAYATAGRSGGGVAAAAGASAGGQSPQGSPKPTYQQPPPSAPGRDSLGETAKEIAAVADALRRQEKEDRDFHEALKKSREEADDYRLKQALRASETDVRREPTPTAAVDGFLAKHGYQKVNVASDGNCQFSALSLLLFGSVQDQAELRRYAVQELKQNPNKYATFVEGSTYDEYMRKMSRDYTWGDHLTLNALSSTLRLSICVLSSNPSAKDGFDLIKIAHPSPTKTVYLALSAEHYTAIVPLPGGKRQPLETLCSTITCSSTSM
eukprot:gene9283-14382_t